MKYESNKVTGDFETNAFLQQAEHDVQEAVFAFKRAQSMTKVEMQVEICMTP